MTEYKKRAIHREQRVEEDEEDGGKVDEEKGEKVAEPEVAEKIVKAVETRQRTVEMLRSFATQADELHKGKGEGEMWTSGIGVTGGLLTVGSGIATIMTAGAAAPIIGALAMSGTATSLIGGGVSIYNTVGSSKTDAELRAKITEIIKEDEEAIQELHRMLVILKLQDDSFNEEVKKRVAGTTVLMGSSLFICLTTVIGFQKTWDVLIMSLPYLATQVPQYALIAMVGAQLANSMSIKVSAEVLSEVGAGLRSTLVNTAATEGLDDFANETVKGIAHGVTRDYVKKQAAIAGSEAYKKALLASAASGADDAAKEAGKIAAKKVARKAYQEAYAKAVKEFASKIAEETTGEVVSEATKQAAKEAAKVVKKEAYKKAKEELTAKAAEEIAIETGKKAAKEAAEEASTQAMKTAGKITGGITAGIGGLTVLWDGYNFKKGYEKKTSNSPLGDQLRTLADKLAKFY